MEQKWSDFCKNCLGEDVASEQRALRALDPALLDLALKESSFAAFDTFFEKNPALFETIPEEAKLEVNSAAITLMKRLFARELKAILPPLYDHFVTSFLESQVNSLSLHEWHALLKRQRDHLLQLDGFCREEASKAKKNAFPYLQKLLSAEFTKVRDLPKRAEKILTGDFAHLLPNEKVLTTEVVADCNRIFHSFFEEQVKEIALLIDFAKEQVVELNRLAGVKTDFLKILQPLSCFKDLQEELARKKTELESDYAKTEEFLQNAVAAAYELKRKRELLEMRMHDAKLTIKGRLFEIFSGISCYKDLTEAFSILAKTLKERITELVDAFYTGKITLREFTSGCQEMAYEHDVVKLRNEISHRSSRLKDLRDEAYQLFNDAQNRRRFFELTPKTTESKEYREQLQFVRKIRALIHEIENPFSAFKNALTKDEINYVFRSMWMKIEELQSQKVEGTEVFVLKVPFLKTLDSLEEVVKRLQGSRPQLVSYYEREFSSEKDITTVENRYPFCKPLAFFMLAPDFSQRQQMLYEAGELEEKIANVRTFAKMMQNIKTFEEERVDYILEAFGRQHLLEEEQDVVGEWRHYQKRMHYAIALVEEEVLLEIGWQDLRALMDVDPVRIQKILRYALEKANKSAEESDTTEMLLEKLSVACHELFDAKLKLASQKNNIVAKTHGIIIELTSLIQRVQKWLETTRSMVQGALGASWIGECHALRHALERFEPTFVDSKELSELIGFLFKEIYKIPEIARNKANGEDPLALENAYQACIQKIALIGKDNDEALPFIYQPGYMRFFLDAE